MRLYDLPEVVLLQFLKIAKCGVEAMDRVIGRHFHTNHSILEIQRMALLMA